MTLAPLFRFFSLVGSVIGSVENSVAIDVHMTEHLGALCSHLFKRNGSIATAIRTFLASMMVSQGNGRARQCQCGRGKGQSQFTHILNSQI